MVDSLPPSGTSGTDPDNETIITNSNGKLSVPLADVSLAVRSSGKIEVIETTETTETTVSLGKFDQDFGDWTGFDRFEEGIASIHVPSLSDLPDSASVTADLTDIDVLTFRIDVTELRVKIKFDGIKEATINDTYGWQTIEISGLDNYGTNTTVTIEAYDEYEGGPGWLQIDYVRGLIQPESGIFELVDTGGSE